MAVREQKNMLSNIDWWMILLFFLLVAIGLINVYASGFNEEHPHIYDLTQVYGKQLIWIGLGILFGFFILIIDSKFFSTFSYAIYIITTLLLIAVLIFGTEVNGSRSWFIITETIRFQPSELAKFSAALVLAKYLSDSSIHIAEWKTRLNVLLILGIPILLIILQNETGSMLVFCSFIFVLYREGLSGNVLIFLFLLIVLFFLTLLLDKLIIIAALGIIAIGFTFFIRRTRRNLVVLFSIFLLLIGMVYSVGYAYEHVLSDHQRKRIDVLLGKVTDIKDAGYNVNQSMIAIGSGGITGKGFLHGTQTRFKFVPEQNTDFIFCTVGEEWGFIGSATVVILYILLLLRIVFIAERQRAPFSRIYGYGLASILFFHVLINIGMTIGLAPVVGIPLPFISYGGSSLLAFSVMLFVFIKQDAVRMQVL
jgi:rod shape determining protein RodA